MKHLLRKKILTTIFLSMLLFSSFGMLVKFPTVSAAVVPGTFDVYFNTSWVDPGDSTPMGVQHKVAYMASRYWVFYSNETHLVYRSSADGTTFTEPTVMRACISGMHMSLAYAPTQNYFGYAYGDNNPNYGESKETTGKYRMGEPQSDGTIDWIADEQVYSTGSFMPVLAYDSTGNPWITDLNSYEGDTYVYTSTEEAGTSVTISTSDHESMLHSGSPTWNGGTQTYGIAGEWWTDASYRRDVIDFDLTDFADYADWGMTSIKLRLYYLTYSDGGDPAAMSTSIYRNTASWAEDTVTWNTAPAFDATPSATWTWGTAPNWVEIDVTDDVRGFLNGTYTNYGWTIKMTTESAVNMAALYLSDDNTGANKPQLVLEGTTIPDYDPGTWHAVSGFPYCINATNANDRGTMPQPVPLADGKMAILYGFQDQPTRAVWWDGTAWDGETTINTDTVPYPYEKGAISVGDRIFFMYRDDSPTTVNKYTECSGYMGAWSATGTLTGGIVNPVVTKNEAGSKVYYIGSSFDGDDDYYVYATMTNTVTNVTTNQGAVAHLNEPSINAYPLGLSAPERSTLNTVPIVMTTQDNLFRRVYFTYFQLGLEFTTVGSTETSAGATTTLYSYWQTADGLTLSQYRVGHNITGTFTNSSWAAFGGTGWANATVGLPTTVGTVVAYEMYATDSSGIQEKTSMQYLTVTTQADSEFTSLVVTLTPSTVQSGGTVTATAIGYDQYGQSLGSYTAAVTYFDGWSTTAGAGGSWASNIYTSATAGSWTVTATIGAISDTAPLIVTSAAPVLSYITVTPDGASTAAGQSKTYTAIAYDQYGASMGDVTGSTVFQITSSAGGHWTGSTYFSENVGEWTITATYSTEIDTTLLTVVEVPTTAALMNLPFDDKQGSSTSTRDWSGWGNTGLISGGTRTTSGYYGMALVFDGNDYITVIDDSSLDLEVTVYLSTRVKVTAFTYESALFDKPNTYGLFLRTDGELSFMVNDQFYNTTTADMVINTWYTVVAEYDGSTVNIYVNSVSEYTSAYAEAIVPSAYDLILGYQFSGTLDEMIVSNQTYAEVNDPIADYPYVYNGYVDSASDWVIASLSYNFTGVYIGQSTTYPITYAKFDFTDGFSTLGLDYTVATTTWVEYRGDVVNDTLKITFISHIATVSGNGLIIQAKIRIENVIQSTSNVDLTLYCESSHGADTLVIADMFNIYGIGGYLMSTLVGDGQLIAGGSPLDVAATNSSKTASGSSARVDMMVPNFQHVHFMTHIYQGTFWDGTNWDEPTYQHDTAYMIFGVQYVSITTLMDGWYVNISIADGLAGATDAWVLLQCDWYNNGELIKSDNIYAAYEAIAENDTTTQFTLYVDLWLSDTMGGTMVGGHVSSQYYGMSTTGWWLWETWSPIGSMATQSSFMDYLYDENGNLTTASALSTFMIWDMVAKTDSGTGDSDACIYAIQSEVFQVKSLPYNVPLAGISTPVFMPATTPDYQMGFFASIANSLTAALDGLRWAIVGALGGLSDLGAGAIDALFGAFGVDSFTSSVSTLLTTLGAYVETSVTSIASLVTSFFMIFSSAALTITEWVGGFVSFIVLLGTYAYNLLTGQPIPGFAGLDSFSLGILGEVFTEIGGFVTSGFIFLALFVWWVDSIDKRAKQYGGGWNSFFMSDIQNVISIFSFVIDMLWRVVTTVIDLTMRFINIFT